MMFASRLRALLVALWGGSLWTIGYMVAPTLFAALPDRMQAGAIAGRLFSIEAWLSVACALLLLALEMRWPHADHGRRRKMVFGIVCAMLLCTLIGYFGVQPFMAALKESAGAAGVMASGAATRFGILHGISSGFYLIQSILAVVLVLKLRAA
jgi:MFS family permease